jgi:hypothetical protein
MSVLLGLLGGSAVASVGPGDAQELRVGGVLVDVREQGEWDTGHAPNAKHHRLFGLAHADGPRLEGSNAGRVRWVRESFGGRRGADQGRHGAVNLTGGLTGSQAACPPILNRREKDQ